jgi:spore maturation protein CgeB
MNGLNEPEPLDIVVLGLSLTSSWGNGHATTYRALLRALAERGHRVLFLERDVPWYASARDLERPDFCAVELYRSLDELDGRFAARVRQADLVIQGSFVPDGIAVGEWMLATARGCKAFYDIDTPVTLEALRADRCEYLARAQVPKFDLYWSFTGGATLRELEATFGARRARPLYCCVDPALYCPTPDNEARRWDLGYMGTYSADRDAGLEALLLATARRLPERRFVVAGPLYPDRRWPDNVERVEHVAPPDHRRFYSAQGFTLNLTRAAMKAAGHSPSVRLFEAAACGTPIISDAWEGLGELFVAGEEILVARSTEDVVWMLSELAPGAARAIGQRARERVLAAHTAAHRAETLEQDLAEARGAQPARSSSTQKVRRTRTPQRYL